MQKAELVIIVSPSSGEKSARGTAWKAIAQVLGTAVTFVADANHPSDCETVTCTQNGQGFLVPISVGPYNAGQSQCDAATLRALIARAFGITPSIEGHLTLLGDPIGLLSSLIELEEEPATALRDQYGLIEGKNSWRSADGLLVPVLELVASSIGKLLEIAAPPALFPGGKAWAVAFSCDLDVLEDEHLHHALNFLDKHQVDRPTFMVCALRENERTIRDVLYDITDAKILRITEPLRRARVEIGLHGSYLAHDHVDCLARQKKILEQTFEQQVRGHRSHFLRFAKPRSWLAQAQAGFDYDASLGYADLPGFRNGCASPIEYRLANDQKIKVFATTFLDQHLFLPSRLDDHAFYALIDPLLDELSQIGGVITLDWHSYTMRGGNYEGWWDRLDYILSQANQAGAYIGGIGSVSDAFFSKSLTPHNLSIPDDLEPPQLAGVAVDTVKINIEPYSLQASSMVSAASESYFEMAETWTERPEAYQVQLRETLKALLGSEKMSALDVGCGNGIITNCLPPHIEVTAVDFSATALRSVKVPKQQASLTALPFPDKSFDFVYCFDVIEHLSEEDMHAGLVELQRVSRKHVLVGVPLNEDLASNSVHCADCGTLYHVNGHLRFHNSEWLEQIPVTDAFERKAIYLSGDTTVPPVNPLIDLYWKSGFYPAQTNMHCPQCGSREVPPSNSNKLPFDLRQILDSFRSAEVVKRVRRCDFWCNRSEGLVLLTRKGENTKLLQPTCTTLQSSVLKINFCNCLQSVEDFTPGALWAKFMLGKGAKLSSKGIGLLDTKLPQTSPTMLRYPVFPRQGDRIMLDVSSDGDGVVTIFGVDGVSNTIQQLEKCSLQGVNYQSLYVNVDAAWGLDRFGLAIDLYVYGTACVHSIQYLPLAEPPCTTFAVVQPGFNLLEISNHGGVPIYWTYHSVAHGQIPVTDCTHAESNESIEPVVGLFGTLWEQRISYKELLVTYAKVKSLNDKLVQLTKTQVETQLIDTKSKLDQALAELAEVKSKLDQAQVETQLIDTKSKLDQKQDHARVELAKAVSKAEDLKLSNEALTTIIAGSWCFRMQKFVGRVIRHVKGKLCSLRGRVARLFFAHGRLNVELALNYPPRWQPVDPQSISSNGGLRVLVFSHMFPNPDQPGSGSFVFDQVQALQQAGADVRVVTCRPFWLISHRSPLLLLGGLYNYVRLFAASSKKWWMVDGVPVRFLPYPIFGPFWTHGSAYSFAVSRNLQQLKKEFDADLIHAHTGYLDGMAARAVSLRLKVPYLITEHTGPFSMLMTNPIIRRATLNSMSHAARVVAVSNALQREITTYQDTGFSMLVIPNIVNVEQFYVAQKWSPQIMSPRLLFVGYFVPIKNLPLLLAAFQKVLEAKPGATLMLVGGDEVSGQQEELMVRIKSLGLSKSVKVKSYVERQEVARLMREECDMLVLSSKSETFGCVVAEALSSGKPAVVTRCGGPEDIVTEDWMGKVCDNNDPAALADAIIDVTNRLPTMQAPRISASAHERFSGASVAASLLALYSLVLSESRTSCHKTTKKGG